MIGRRTKPGSETESVLPSATEDGHSVYQAEYTCMVGHNHLIGHRTVLQSGGENAETAATAEQKMVKASAFATCVGRREDLKSEAESPNPSAMGKLTL